MCLKAIAALLQFTTIFPLGKPADFEQFARHSYLYPIAGYAIGIPVALCVVFIPSAGLAAAIAIALLLLITGCNHFDGLLDFGDALMAHGSREKRLQALTDIHVGAGGVAFGIAVVLITFAALLNIKNIVYAILIAEVFAKFSMSLLTTWGKPFREGIHSYLHSFSKAQFPLYSALLCIPLLLLPGAYRMVGTAALVAVLCALGMRTIGNTLFGGINGDFVGATNEITRALIFLAIAMISQFPL
ncbi:MAG: adenosylcobinamide-GDP ribazoletransferase [Methanoregulaceae archaeon]